MKRILFAVMALVLCAALVLSGCQRETAARESYEQNLPQQSDREEAPEQEPYEEQFPEAAQPEKDADWYAEKYIRGLSLQRLEDFETPADLPANDLVAFFFMANYDGENKLPIPEGYRSNTNGALLLPGDEVESFVAALMEGVEEGDLRASQYYNEEKHIYELNGFGVTSGGSRVEVTDYTQQGDRVELVFDVYAQMTDAQGEPMEIGPTATRCAVFLDQGDRFKVLSLETLFQADMDKLMEEAGLM